MAITRRQFIKRSGLVAAGGFLGSGLFGNPLLRRALAQALGDRYFVVVYLDGGNDGLNTVTPASSGSLRNAYDAARSPSSSGGLRLSGPALAGTLIGNDPGSGTTLALHPGLIGLKQLYDPPYQKLAVVQGCGYPNYSLSHEQARVIWQTADPIGTGVGTGWLGRYLAANYGGSDIPAVNIADSVVGEFKQGATSVLTLSRLADFGFPFDDYYSGDDGAKKTAFLALCSAASSNAQSTVHYLGDSGRATLLSSESYPQLEGHYLIDRPGGQGWSDQYDAIGRSVANDLREVAKVIYGVETGLDPTSINARFFQVSNGGYDTHSDQGGATGQQYDLHREVGDSLKLFYDDCADMGVADKLCVLVWSEFSRRVPQNDSGTDHGSQGPTFVIGGGVNSGVYGNHPNIADAALDNEGNTVYTQNANPFRSTDIRDVYGTILKHWVGLTQSAVLSILPADGGDPASYWTAPNFDLGFLP
jgi:uncharacterized protein (DUF1501 family)